MLLKEGTDTTGFALPLLRRGLVGLASFLGLARSMILSVRHRSGLERAEASISAKLLRRSSKDLESCSGLERAEESFMPLTTVRFEIRSSVDLVLRTDRRVLGFTGVWPSLTPCEGRRRRSRLVLEGAVTAFPDDPLEEEPLEDSSVSRTGRGLRALSRVWTGS